MWQGAAQGLACSSVGLERKGSGDRPGPAAEGEVRLLLLTPGCPLQATAR